MPHSVFDLGAQTSDARAGSRQLVAGIEPGKRIRSMTAQRRTKPALMVLDCFAELLDFQVAGGTQNRTYSQVYLALSQQQDLNPSLILPVAQIGAYRNRVDASSEYGVSPELQQLFRAQGTTWCPRYVGARIEHTGGVDPFTFEVDVHLDWDIVEIDWWEWFYKWNQLEAHPDGELVDGQREYL